MERDGGREASICPASPVSPESAERRRHEPQSGQEADESDVSGATLGHRRRSDLGAGAQETEAEFPGATDTSPALVSGERWHPESRSGAQQSAGRGVGAVLVRRRVVSHPFRRLVVILVVPAEFVVAESRVTPRS